MKRFIRITLALTLVSILALSVVGCSTDGIRKNDSAAAAENSGSLTRGALEVRVTDAPPKDDVTGILLTVSKIEVHRASSGEKTATPTATPTDTATPTATPTPTSTATPTTDPEEGWIPIEITGTQTFDLLKIKGLEEVFAYQTLEVGKYTQVRVTVDKAEVALGDDTPKEATVPSGVLKFIQPFEIKSGETTVIVIDFDAAQSVVVTGNGGIIVKPVVKLSTKTSGESTPPPSTTEPAS